MLGKSNITMLLRRSYLNVFPRQSIDNIPRICEVLYVCLYIFFSFLILEFF